MSPAPEKVDHVLPHDPLTPIIGKPTYASIKLLKQELYANALSVQSNAGGGMYGHLGLIMPATEYNALPDAATWIDPIAPKLPDFAPTTRGAVISLAEHRWSVPG